MDWIVMAHSSSTSFPVSIDPRMYYSDISLQHTDILDGYNNLVSSGQYQQASRYLYNNVEVPNVNVDYNGAYLWNMFDNRIEAIESYAYTMPATDSRCYYSRYEPTTKTL